ncbi:MAG: peptidoglycan-associated lipoprotein Pal [Deltaproteobacteria bacterium]|nr:peptidoglycan-associated lipoprotein Pal [Deltaproteobacteria bacterium]
MKKNLTLMGIFVLIIFGLTIFTGCSENKSVVTKDTTQETAPTAVQKTETAKPADVSNMSAINQNEAAKEQPVQMDQTALAYSSVRDINFDFDSSIIRPDARDILKTNADFLSKKRVSVIVIEGHCDEKGTDEYNMALGQRRAQETKQYLINLGVKESLIRTVSYGEERPLDPASNEEAWAKNRRAHFVVNP